MSSARQFKSDVDSRYMDTSMWLTAKGWLYAGYAEVVACLGDGERSCVVTIRKSKPSMRCEFCERTVRLRAAVAA